MKLMLRYTLRYKKLLLFDFISVFGFILIELGLPTILAMMIDKGIGNNDFNYVQKMGILMIAITVVGIVMSISLRYFSSQITSRMVAAIRDDLFEKIQSFSHSEYEQIGVSSLVTRITSDAFVLMQFADYTHNQWCLSNYAVHAEYFDYRFYDTHDVWHELVFDYTNESRFRDIRVVGVADTIIGSHPDRKIFGTIVNEAAKEPR